MRDHDSLSPGRSRERRDARRSRGVRDGADAPQRPAALLAACFVVLLEALLVLGLGLRAVVEFVRVGSVIPGAMVFLAAFCVLVALVLVVAVRALVAGKRWARSPVITWQVLLASMAVGWFGAEQTAATAVVLVGTVLVVVCLLLPSVVAATTPAPATRAPTESAPESHEPGR